MSISHCKGWKYTRLENLTYGGIFHIIKANRRLIEDEKTKEFTYGGGFICG
jgi:hypothetical protein